MMLNPRLPGLRLATHAWTIDVEISRLTSWAIGKFGRIEFARVFDPS